MSNKPAPAEQIALLRAALSDALWELRFAYERVYANGIPTKTKEVIGFGERALRETQ